MIQNNRDFGPLRRGQIIIDIQRHRRRRGRVTGAVDVDHRGHHPGQLACGRRIFPPAHRWLAGQPRARSRQLAQRQSEARIVTQSVEIIGVLVAARDREHAGTQYVIKAMDHPRRIARIGNASRKPPAKPHRALGLCQQQNTAIRGEPTSVERGCDLLAPDRWKRKSRRAIIAPGGCGPWHKLPRCRNGLDTHFPTSKQSLKPLPPTLLTEPDE